MPRHMTDEEIGEQEDAAEREAGDATLKPTVIDVSFYVGSRGLNIKSRLDNVTASQPMTLEQGHKLLDELLEALMTAEAQAQKAGEHSLHPRQGGKLSQGQLENQFRHFTSAELTAMGGCQWAEAITLVAKRLREGGNRHALQDAKDIIDAWKKLLNSAHAR